MLKGEFWSLPVAGVESGARRETAAATFALARIGVLPMVAQS
jgi:hypothetical protein